MLRLKTAFPQGTHCLSSTGCLRSGIIIALTDDHGIEIKGQG